MVLEKTPFLYSVYLIEGGRSGVVGQTEVWIRLMGTHVDRAVLGNKSCDWTSWLDCIFGDSHTVSSSKIKRLFEHSFSLWGHRVQGLCITNYPLPSPSLSDTHMHMRSSPISRYLLLTFASSGIALSPWPWSPQPGSGLSCLHWGRIPWRQHVRFSCSSTPRLPFLGTTLLLHLLNIDFVVMQLASPWP